jgi:hypothetical protein
MDPVEAEEQQTEPPDEEEEAYAEADPTGRFIRVRRRLCSLFEFRGEFLSPCLAAAALLRYLTSWY